MKGLTQKQKNIIEFINDFMNRQEMAPTIYEIAEHFKIKTSTVFAHIRALQKKSCLTRSSKARSICLTHPRTRTRFPAGVHSIPFHGASDSKQERGLVCDAAAFSSLADSAGDFYAMRVEDAGLTNRGIFSGDILIVKEHPASVGNDDIVVTEVDGRDVLRQAKESILNSPAGLDATGFKGVVVGLQRRIGK